MSVKAKKHLGQHFLKDENIALKIVKSMEFKGKVLEIGPGMGVLTKYLLEQEDIDTHVIEIDIESVEWLKEHYPKLEPNIISANLLKTDLSTYFTNEFGIIGNFPYNISSQILFKVLEYKNQIPELVGMFQKEVAERVAAKPGSKTYGITSVLIQAWYDIEYLFTVHEHVFAPPPKVKSAVIRLKRNNVQSLECDEKLFVKIVKAAFNQRRKTIRNSLKAIIQDKDVDPKLLANRPEQLSISEFIDLTKQLM